MIAAAVCAGGPLGAVTWLIASRTSVSASASRSTEAACGQWTRIVAATRWLAQSRTGPALGGDQRQQAPRAVVAEQQADERVARRDRQEALERGRQRGDRVVRVLGDRLLDGVEQTAALADHERLAELVPGAELVVEGLAADAGGGGDLRHRHLRPRATAQLLAARIEEPVAQQLPDRPAI